MLGFAVMPMPRASACDERPRAASADDAASSSMASATSTAGTAMYLVPFLDPNGWMVILISLQKRQETPARPARPAD
jgi:hypothetical protein